MLELPVMGSLLLSFRLMVLGALLAKSLDTAKLSKKQSFGMLITSNEKDNKRLLPHPK
jgi:hypothetical protein